MRNNLLSPTAVGIGSSSPVDRWINENSQKSICCRFNGFLLWIVGSLVKQIPKDSWIVSYKIADLLARCASHRDIPMSWLPEYCHSSPWWKKPFRMVHWTLTFEVGWVRSSGEHQRPSTSQRLFASTMLWVYLPCCVSGCGRKIPWRPNDYCKSTNTTTVDVMNWRFPKRPSAESLGQVTPIKLRWGVMGQGSLATHIWEKSQHLCGDENDSQ